MILMKYLIINLLIEAGKNDRVPDFVFLAHVVDMISSMHVPFVFRSLSSKPFVANPLFLIVWPIAFAVMLLMWVFSKTFTLSFYYLRDRLHQTWVVPRYGFQVKIINQLANQERLASTRIKYESQLLILVFCHCCSIFCPLREKASISRLRWPY